MRMGGAPDRGNENGAPQTYVLRDSLPHEYLKPHPQYRAAFDQRLRELLLPAPGSSPPAGAGAFTQSSILARFDRLAGDIRKTLEAEMMRWGDRFDDFDQHSPGSDPAPLRAAWVVRINNIRFPPSGGTPADARLALARPNLKTAARWARLLNDIPPPTITWNPATGVATATRGGSVGRVYINSGENLGDPIDQYSEPTYQPGDSASVVLNAYPNDHFVWARVFAPDLDGVPGWSAISIFQIP